MFASTRLASIVLGCCLILSANPPIGLQDVSAKPAIPAGSEKTNNPNSPVSPVSPIGLYHHVWQLIADNYFDPTFNGQNWHFWEHKYDKHLHSFDDARKAIETMLASLGDRYTRYLNPTAFADEKQQIDARLYGIGIQMGLDKTNKLIVIAPIEDTPAARAGLQPLDEIIKIDGTASTGLSVEEASKLIRGPIDTTVLLTIRRNKKTIEERIIRAEIPIKSVQTVRMLNGDVGYIRLATFMSEHAAGEMRAALEKLSPANGLIIDLRNNPGGLVSNAIQICSLFLDSGIIVSTINRNGVIQSARANGSPISKQRIVILINQGSASASEITSGALRDCNRARLVGVKSFGKGLVQSITRLEDGGGINTTIARYLTPNNTDIHKKGILPDYKVELSADDYAKGKGPWWIGSNGTPPPTEPDWQRDLQLKRAVQVLQENPPEETNQFRLHLDPFPNSSPGN